MINFIGFSLIFTVILAAIIITVGIWVWSIVDCIKSDKSQMEKIMWILVILLFSIIGSIIYFLLKDSINKEDTDKTLDSKSNKSSKKNKKNKTIKRSSSNRVIAGVCGGMGEYFHIDPTIIRLFWVLLTIFSFGTGLLLYAVSAIIIPEDKNSSSSNRKDEKPKPRNKNLVPIIATIAVVLVVLILAVMTISIVAIDEYSTELAVQESGVHRIDISSMPSKQKAEMIVKDHIRTHPTFKTYSGYGLNCPSIENSDDNVCSDYKDPYGIKIANSNCYKITCNFMTNEASSKGYFVNTIISGNRVRAMSFKPMSKSESLNTEIKTLKDCKENGHDIVYPKLKGGPLVCDTGEKNINISTNDSYPVQTSS